MSATTTLSFNFSFSVDQSTGLTPAQAFSLSAAKGDLSAGVSFNTSNWYSAIDIGFLGANVVNGTVQMDAQLTNGAAISSLSLGSLLSGTTPAMSTSGSVKLALPLQATLGSQNASGTLTISSNDLASTAPTVSWTGFAGWQDFTTVIPDNNGSNSAVLGMLNQLGGQLGQLAQQTWNADYLPFLGNLSLAQAANLTQTFQAAVTNQIASWSGTLERSVTQFTTAQDLAALLAQVLDVSPSSINVQFSPTTNVLTYHLSYTSHPFTNLLNQTPQVNLDQGGVTNASLTGGQLSLIPTVTTALTFGIDLAPLGSNFPTMTTQTLLSSLNGGTGVGAIGTSDDFNVILSDGTNYTVSLINPATNKPCTTVGQIINAIETATQNRVQVTIDSLSQKSLDVTQLPNTPIALDFNQVPSTH